MRSVALVVLLAIAGCRSKSSATRDVDVAPRPFGETECAVCSMVLREQRSPRAQIVYRDGERSFLCALGELPFALAEASPHGPPVAIYVEVQDPAADPRANETRARPWKRAEEASYVLWISRSGIMGTPALAYASPAAAAQVAERFGGRMVDWPGLRAALLKPAAPVPGSR